jgi:branched-chain amino acid transport system permease protein
MPLSHIGIWAVGAYSSAIFSTKVGMSVWLTIIIGALVAALFSYVIGLLSFRVKGHYFAILTLAFSEILIIIARNWVNLTGGAMGIVGIPTPRIHIPGILDFSFSSRISFYYLFLAVTLGVLFFLWRLIHSPLGRAFIAIREDETLAQFMGLKSMNFKLLSFCISGCITGLSGALFSHYQQILGPSNFAFAYLAQVLAVIMVGGSRTFWGPVIGCIILVPLPELLRLFERYRHLVFGALLIITIIYAPKGLVGFFEDFREKRVNLKDG